VLPAARSKCRSSKIWVVWSSRLGSAAAHSKGAPAELYAALPRYRVRLVICRTRDRDPLNLGQLCRLAGLPQVECALHP
jgi:hypothetical protein